MRDARCSSWKSVFGHHLHRCPAATGPERPPDMYHGWRSSMKNPTTGTAARRPTQRDIALATGMSQTAVSLVLNHVEPSTVSVQARERILRTAERLGYVPNRMARNLRSARTHALACIVPDLTNPTYPSLVRGFQSAADAAG